MNIGLNGLCFLTKQQQLDQKILKEIERLPEEDRLATLTALERYNREGVRSKYWTEPEKLIRFIRNQQLFKNSGEVVDLGAGPGDLVEELAREYPRKRICGIDLSSEFVGSFNSNRAQRLPNATMDVGLIDQPRSIGSKNRASVISVLTLDRVSNPAILIENMAKYSKSRVLATLLPIIGEDDNPSLQAEGTKRVYTPPAKRIVPGRRADEDRGALMTLLQKSWKKPIAYSEVEYVVNSSGDRQEYTLGVFFTS